MPTSCLPTKSASFSTNLNMSGAWGLDAYMLTPSPPRGQIDSLTDSTEKITFLQLCGQAVNIDIYTDFPMTISGKKFHFTPRRNIKRFLHMRFCKSFWLNFSNGSLREFCLLLKMFGAYLRNKQIVFQNNIAEKYHKIRGSELHCNISRFYKDGLDNYRFPKINQKVHSHLGNNIIYVMRCASNNF